jgi:hypothetical protein
VASWHRSTLLASSIAAAVIAIPIDRGIAQTTDRLKTDWAYLERYRADNATLAPPQPARTASEALRSDQRITRILAGDGVRLRRGRWELR